MRLSRSSRFKTFKNIKYRYGAKLKRRSGMPYFMSFAGLLSMVAVAGTFSYALDKQQPPYVLRMPTRLLHAISVTRQPSKPLSPMPMKTPEKPATTVGAFRFNHTDIITTIFWAGEGATSDNGYISNAPSAWDGQWAQHFGGEDKQEPRNGYLPAGFTPKENAFYFALPYNDMTVGGARKASAKNCPNAGNKAVTKYSWCKNTWIAIRSGNKIAYAQWEDVGPFEEDDTAYVFGSAAPKNKFDAKAGLDVSPAVATYLKMGDVSRTDWTFVSADSVPDGPWKKTITTYPGYTVN